MLVQNVSTGSTGTRTNKSWNWYLRPRMFTESNLWPKSHLWQFGLVFNRHYYYALLPRCRARQSLECRFESKPRQYGLELWPICRYSVNCPQFAKFTGILLISNNRVQLHPILAKLWCKWVIWLPSRRRVLQEERGSIEYCLIIPIIFCRTLDPILKRNVFESNETVTRPPRRRQIITAVLGLV